MRHLCFLLFIWACWTETPARGQAPPLTIEAIQYSYPGARLVVSGGVVVRWDGPMARPTDAELAQAQTNYTAAIANTVRFTAMSRHKDVLTTCALVVRARGIAAWNAMTIAQKTSATLAECDVWENIREFVEVNVN